MHAACAVALSYEKFELQQITYSAAAGPHHQQQTCPCIAGTEATLVQDVLSAAGVHMATGPWAGATPRPVFVCMHLLSSSLQYGGGSSVRVSRIENQQQRASTCVSTSTAGLARFSCAQDQHNPWSGALACLFIHAHALWSLYTKAHDHSCCTMVEAAGCCDASYCAAMCCDVSCCVMLCCLDLLDCVLLAQVAAHKVMFSTWLRLSDR
jgi:hypothetical protein